MTNKIDTFLEKRRKETDGDIEYKIQCLKGEWKLLFFNKRTWAVITGLLLGLICLGIYFEWNSKNIIITIFNWGIPSLITALILENREKDKNREL